jgi:hypothetical protein
MQMDSAIVYLGVEQRLLTLVAGRGGVVVTPPLGSQFGASPAQALFCHPRWFETRLRPRANSFSDTLGSATPTTPKHVHPCHLSHVTCHITISLLHLFFHHTLESQPPEMRAIPLILAPIW